MAAASASSEFFSRGQIKADWIWIAPVSAFVGLVADFLSVLGPVALHGFLICTLLAAAVLLVGYVFARTVAFCRKCFWLCLLTAGICLAVFSVQHGQRLAGGVLASSVPSVADLQEALFYRLNTIDAKLESAQDSLEVLTDNSDQTIDLLNRNQKELLRQTAEINETLLILTRVVAEKTGVPEAALRSVLLKFGETESDADVLALLEQKAAEFKELKANLAAIRSPSEAVIMAKAEAARLLDSGDFQGAREVLERIRNALREQRETITIEEGKVLGQIGATYLLESEYRLAAATYAEAAKLVEFDVALSASMRIEQGNALHDLASRRRDALAAFDAKRVYSDLASRMIALDEQAQLANAYYHRADVELTLYEIARVPRHLDDAIIDVRATMDFYEFLYSNGYGDAVSQSPTFPQFLAVSARVNLLQYRRTMNENFAIKSAANYEWASELYQVRGNPAGAQVAEYNKIQVLRELGENPEFAGFAFGGDKTALASFSANPDRRNVQTIWNEAALLLAEVRDRRDPEEALRVITLFEEGLALLDPESDAAWYFRFQAAVSDLEIYRLIWAAQPKGIEHHFEKYKTAIEALIKAGEFGYYYTNLFNYGFATADVGYWRRDLEMIREGEMSMAKAALGFRSSENADGEITARRAIASFMNLRAITFGDHQADISAVNELNCAMSVVPLNAPPYVRLELQGLLDAARATCVNLNGQDACSPPQRCYGA